MAALLAALSLVSCSSGGDDGDTFVLRLDGRAELEGAERLEAGEHRLEVGDVVRITQGKARLGLPGKRSVELRAGDGSDSDSRLEVATAPTLIDGHALLVAGDDEAVQLRAGKATIALRAGAARVRRSTGVNLAVYEGTAEVESLGQELPRPLRALRQVVVADSGALPRRVLPLVFDRDDLDPWDRRYLGPAIALGGRLDRASSALNREVDPPASGPDAEFLRTLVPGLRSVPDFGGTLLTGRRSSVGETVVGASIALGGDGSFTERWTSAFDFRDQGADWGLVALDQQARREAVIGVLDGILDAVAATLPVFGRVSSGNGGGRGAGASPDPGVPPTAPPSDPTRPEEPVLPDPDGDTPPLLPPVTVPPFVGEPNTQSPPPEPDGLLGPVTDGVDGLVESVDGLLGPVDGLLGG